jgi:ATP-binding cassette subfamily B protein
MSWARPAGPGSGGWLRRFWPLWWAHRGLVGTAIVSSVVAISAQQVTPLLQRDIIDHHVVGHSPGHLTPLLGAMLALYLLQFAVGQLRRYAGGRVSWSIDYDLRNTVFSHLQGLDFSRHDEMPTGQLVSRTNSDLALIRTLLGQLPNVLANVLQFLLALGIMLALSPVLTAVVAPMVPALFLFALRMRMVVYPSQWEAQARMAEMVGVVDDAVTGVRVVKGFGQGTREVSKVRAALRVLYGSRLRNLRLRSRRTSTLETIPSLALAAVLTFGGWLALDHQVSVGTLVVFFTYLTQLAAPARQMAGLVVTAQQARAGAERVLELLDSLPEVGQAPDAVDLPEVRGAISFEGVSFGYLRSEPVLRDFDLSIAPGETVAIVGTSGSGKSTIGLLLPRFYDVQEGVVRVDGRDVRGLTFDSLRRRIGVVFEDAFLFSDTVRANIAFGRPDATDAEIERAARAAEAHDFVMELPDGYETVVGERGLLVSGGQRQRITLARALLTDPRILLLDDATSSVDSRVEEEIHATLRRLMVGRTTILIAHRRSTLRLAQRIVVLERGHVVDQGAHEELLDRCPLYRDLLAGPEEEPVDAMATEMLAEVTAGAWDEPVPDPAGTRPAVTAAPRSGGGGLGRGMGGGMGGGMRAALGAPPSERLMRQIEALPPVRDEPDVDEERELRPHGRPFSFPAFVRPFLPQLLVGLVLVALDAGCGLIGPALTSSAIDHGVLRHDLGVLLRLSGVFFGVQLLDWWAMWAETLWTGRTSERVLYSIRLRIFAHLQRLGLDFYDREMSGRILTRITSDVDTISSLLQSGLINALVNAISFLGVAAILAVMNVHLALLVLAVVPPLAVSTVWYRLHSSRAYDRQRDRISAVNADFQENVSGMRVTHAFRREQRNTDNFQLLAGQFRDAGIHAQWLQSVYFPFAGLAGQVAILIVLGVGSHLVHSGQLTVGELVAFLLYLTQLFAPVQQLSQVFDTYQQASAGLRKIGGLLNTAVSTPEPAAPRPVGRLSGAVTFSGVRFRYAGTNHDAVAGLDLAVAPGETVALVGETGAGKSTVMKLLARFYDPDAGVVAVDGIPLPDLAIEAFRQQLGYVPQEPFLFGGTIRENIAYGRPDAGDAEVEAAARAVGAHDHIVRLGGYLKRVSERGRSLSIGQRQLLCLARAQLVDPAILLLDEATSNLDLATEAQVNRAMGVVSHGRTTILIAHRLQTARRADRIVVIDRGRIVEEGSHDELVARGGQYASMWAAFEVEVAA